MLKFNLRRILILTAGWILLAFIFSGIRYLAIVQEGVSRPIEWRNIFYAQLIIYAWAVLAPLIIFFAKRFPCGQRNWWRVLPAHIAAAAVFLILHATIFCFVQNLIDPAAIARAGGFLGVTEKLVIRNWMVDLSMYCVLLSSIYVIDFYRRYQAEQLKSSELKAALATSQLSALKMQIHPHFLFNTLNSISALMHEDVRAADKMVARLGDFLRTTLENAGDREVSLKQEMAFVEQYLEIESVRFQDRLVVKLDIDPETFAARVPNLILQPIVENAIKHGISRQTKVGSLSISSERRGDRVHLRVEDSGPGLQSSNKTDHEKKTGIGLANTRERLTHLYGENYRFEIKNAEPHGLIVALEIPFETVKDSPAKTNQVEVE